MTELTNDVLPVEYLSTESLSDDSNFDMAKYKSKKLAVDLFEYNGYHMLGGAPCILDTFACNFAVKFRSEYSVNVTGLINRYIITE